MSMKMRKVFIWIVLVLVISVSIGIDIFAINVVKSIYKIKNNTESIITMLEENNGTSSGIEIDYDNSVLYLKPSENN